MAIKLNRTAVAQHVFHIALRHRYVGELRGADLQAIGRHIDRKVHGFTIQHSIGRRVTPPHRYVKGCSTCRDSFYQAIADVVGYLLVIVGIINLQVVVRIGGRD